MGGFVKRSERGGIGCVVGIASVQWLGFLRQWVIELPALIEDCLRV